MSGELRNLEWPIDIGTASVGSEKPFSVTHVDYCPTQMRGPAKDPKHPLVFQKLMIINHRLA